MNYVATPDEIDAFGDTLTNEFGPRATTILNNVKNAELHYLDFGPFLAGFCADFWFSTHNAMLTHTTSIADNVLHAADRFREAAATYRSTDDAGRQEMDRLHDELYGLKGTTLDAKSAPKDAPADGAWRDMDNSYYEKPGERTNYGDRVKSALPGFAGKLANTMVDKSTDVELKDIAKDAKTLYTSLSADIAAYIADPLGFLVNNGLSFLLKVCTPLKMILDAVSSGNPDALKAAANRYADIAKDLERLATDLVGAAQRDIPHWEGEAAEAAAAKLDLFVQGIHGTAGVAGDMAAGLLLIATLSKALEDVVIGILSDVVKWLILIWLKAIALAVETGGASTAEAAYETEAVVAKETEKAATTATKVGGIFSRAGQAFKRMATKIMQNEEKRYKFLEGLKKVETPSVKGEAKKSVDRITGKDGGKAGEKAKRKEYGTTAKTMYEDSKIGTDESDPVIEQQLNFDG